MSFSALPFLNKKEPSLQDVVIKLFSGIRIFLKTIQGLFYPPHCAGCQQALLTEDTLCEGCWNKMTRLSRGCLRCSYPLKTEQCQNCSGRELYFVAGVSAFAHQGLVRELIARYKYGRDQSLKKVMRKLIVEALLDQRLQGIVFSGVIPVPLYFLRERERGFNQALLLAHEVARHLNLPLLSILRRKKSTSHQAASDRKERLKKLEGAFILKHHEVLEGNYLLVDDVLTTGATLAECAKVILQAGATGVWAVTVAR